MIKDMTILMPVAKCNDFARQAIGHLLENFDNNIHVLYDENEPKDYVSNERIKYIKNQYGRNFPKILNQLFISNEKQFGFLCNWRQRPKKANIEFAIDKINSGFGFVDLESPLLCSVYSNHIFSKIGLIDERYIGGHCIDWDIVYTLKYHNIAHYCVKIEKPDYSLASSENPTYSTWHNDPSNVLNYSKFDIKWNFDGKTLKRILREKNYNDRKLFEIKFKEIEYLPHSKSVIEIKWVKEKLNMS